MPRVMQQRGARLGLGWGVYSVGPSIIDTIRREVIRTLTAWSGLHAATTNFLRHLARSFTAKAPLVLFTGFSMRLLRPFNTDTCVLTADGKLFSPVIDPPFFFFFQRGKKSRTIRVAPENRYIPDCDQWAGVLNGKSKIDDMVK